MQRHVYRSQRRQSRGMTSAVYLLVMPIILVIAGLVVPRLLNRQKQANIDAATLSIKGLEQALKLYAIDHDGEYPTSDHGLDAMMQPPSEAQSKRWKGPYLEEPPRDPWGRPFVYAYPGTHPIKSFDLSSMGADGIAGNEDDIANWIAAE